MKTKNGVILFITATIWGVAFVAQSEAADHIGAFTFNSIRALLGGLVLIPVIHITKKHWMRPYVCGDSFIRIILREVRYG